MYKVFYCICSKRKISNEVYIVHFYFQMKNIPHWCSNLNFVISSLICFENIYK